MITLVIALLIIFPIITPAVVRAGAGSVEVISALHSELNSLRLQVIRAIRAIKAIKVYSSELF